MRLTIAPEFGGRLLRWFDKRANRDVLYVNPIEHTRLTRFFPSGTARGVKLFLLGDLPADLYTDGDSRYLELWGGYTRTFSEDATLQPGRVVTWSEWWSAR